MGDRAHQPSVLHDRAAGHALHDAARALDQLRIGDVQHDRPHRGLPAEAQMLNFAIERAHAIIDRG